MYGYGSILILITPFIEYILKVTIKIIFHHSKTLCKIYKLSILMTVRGGGGLTKSDVLLFIGEEKSEFSQEKARKFYRQLCVGTMYYCIKVYWIHTCTIFLQIMTKEWISCHQYKCQIWLFPGNHLASNPHPVMISDWSIILGNMWHRHTQGTLHVFSKVLSK